MQRIYADPNHQAVAFTFDRFCGCGRLPQRINYAVLTQALLGL